MIGPLWADLHMGLYCSISLFSPGQQAVEPMMVRRRRHSVFVSVHPEVVDHKLLSGHDPLWEGASVDLRHGNPTPYLVMEGRDRRAGCRIVQVTNTLYHTTRVLEHRERRAGKRAGRRVLPRIDI